LVVLSRSHLIVVAACAAFLYFPSLAARLKGAPFQNFFSAFGIAEAMA
jgi:hypothetical protein